MTILDSAVTSSDDGATYDFRCPGIDGSPCGDDKGVPFTSTGWPSAETAGVRGQQHFDEHKGLPPVSLEDFRAEHGLTPADDGLRAVRIEDLP